MKWNGTTRTCVLELFRRDVGLTATQACRLVDSCLPWKTVDGRSAIVADLQIREGLVSGTKEPHGRAALRERMK